MSVDILRSERILVTGATGFVGACLVRRLLALGARPHIFLREKSDTWRIREVIDRLDLHYLDLDNYDRLESIIGNVRPTVIYHLAAYGGHVFQKDADKIIKTNILGTVNLVNACKNVKFKIFVNTGSSSEYGIKSNMMPENDLLEPVGEYGVSKAAATLYCQSISRKENKPMVTLRLFSPYGYYEDPSRLFPSVILSCLKGKNPKVSSPDSVRDFIFIEDVIDVYIKIVRYSNVIKGEIFNLGYGKQSSVQEVVDKVIKLVNNRVAPEWGAISNRRIEPESWQADIAKIKKILDWEPKCDLACGIKKSIGWFKKNMHLYREI